MATLKIRRAQQTLEILNVDLNGTVAQLKTQIAATTSIQPASQRLVFGGRVLEDGSTLSSFGISSGATLHMVVKDSAPAATPAPAAVPAARPGASAGTESAFGPLSPGPGGAAPVSDELRAFIQQIASSPDGQMMFAAALQNPAILVEFARQNPQLAPLLQEAVANPAALLEMLQPPQRAPGEPYISREIFNVAIRCLNGEPLPEEYQMEEEGEEGDEAEQMDVSGDSSAPAAPVAHEFISRDQIAYAIAFAQGRAGDAPPPAAAPARGPPPPAARPAAPPAVNTPEALRQRYGPQLAQLTAMGFPEDMCLRALQMANGDVNSAIAILLG